MARRKKGLPISGWLIIDKPKGVTSSDVVNKLRWRYNAQKAGHGGTLDPDATGVLPIAFGEATKLLPFLEDSLKSYEFWVKWGAETSTDDASGEILRESDAQLPNRQDIIALLPNYHGEIMQIPPQVSAVKVDGQRAYDLARQGEALELKARPLWVEELTMIDEEKGRAKFLMRCGKGGYVRSIARDLGRDLGVLGHVDSLRRTETLGFDESEAIGFEAAVENTPELISLLDTPLLEHMNINQGHADALRVGREIFGLTGEGYYLAVFDDAPIAVIDVENCVGRVARGLQNKPQ